MSKFLRLTEMIINTKCIKTIKILPNKYEISLIDNYIGGLSIGGFGYVNTLDNIIHVCKIERKVDYEIFTDWLNNNKI